MDNPRSVVPIFFADDARSDVRPEGTGVLLALGGEVFLLTAAHVTDKLERGTLLVPGEAELLAVNGHLSHVPLPAGGTRDADPIDIAYLRLSPETRLALHPVFEPLVWNQLGIFETLCEGDLYTFSGFPASRSRILNRVLSSEMFKFTGGAASDSVYGRLGYAPWLHIAIIFDRQKAVVGDRIQTAPHPKGLSGGGIFSWPKTVRSAPSIEQPTRLVGIAHTYHEHSSCLVGTRINGYLAAIFRNNPHLVPDDRSRTGGVPLVAGVAWYRADEWSRLKAEFADAEKMHATWHEWREAAQRTIEQMRLRGRFLIPVELTAQEISEYCSRSGLPNTSRTRIELGNRRLRDLAREAPIGQS